MKLIVKNNKYTLKIDVKRNIVYESPNGYFKPEDVERLHLDYKEKIIPLFKGDSWAKCVDLRGYKMSMITQPLKDYVEWAIKNGLRKGAIIVDCKNIYKSVIHLQMIKSTEGTVVFPYLFESKKDALDWLGKEGY